MAYLNSNQRSFLEKAVISARKAAESGAINALKALAIHHHEPYSNMEQDKRVLRNRLRYKGRLLGDTLENNGTQQIDNLVIELAYEYWHKMLFAKFLEVNGLLMHPTGVAVSLQECEELASAENFVDKWQAASVYASKMLPAIFRPEDPIMAVEYAAEDRIKLESILEAIPDETFTADDSLGWVYQFWQSEAKDAINKSGDKIDGKKLPAVTQLFTEPYMVHFLIDNSIGAWWVSRNPGVTPPVDFKYLRFLDDGTPAAGRFEGWPDKTKDVTSLDPCMGSGHFIVAQFEVFVKLRMYEEGFAPEDAAKAVILENLHGLELDPRCTQIAAFNLALSTWKFVGNYFLLPEMNLACSGVAPIGKKEEWIRLAGNNEQLKQGMEYLYSTFQSAPILGSLIEPNQFEERFDFFDNKNLLPLLDKALKNEGKDDNTDVIERGIAARGIAMASNLQLKKYWLLITNVPYLSKSKQNSYLTEYLDLKYPEAKNDLATVFIERMLKFLVSGGLVSTVVLQNWLFLTTYRKFREKLLIRYQFGLIARLGPKGFRTPMWDFNVMLFNLYRTIPIDCQFTGIDVSNQKSPEEKDTALREVQIKSAKQNKQLKNPDAVIVFDSDSISNRLNIYAKALQGIATGDYNRFGRIFNEVPVIDGENWIFQQTTFSIAGEYKGKENIIFWQNGNGTLCKSESARIQGLDSLTRTGIAISQMSSLFATINTKTLFDNNTSVILPKDPKYLLPIWCFCSSNLYNEEVRRIDQKISVTNATLVKVPFNYEFWLKVAQERYPTGLPKPYSDDPTQWLFHGHPIKTEFPLQVGVARFLGYRWPAESDEKMELAEEARELINSIKPFDELSDEDGIVCIPSVNGELAASERIRAYLSKVFGSQWEHDTLEQLLKKENAKSATFETWLRDEFFEQHYKLFNNRPFIWQIWDGRKDGFSVLVNYHNLTKENLQKLIYTYLGDWIRQCEMKVKNGESGADGLLIAAKKLKEKLELILKGENPYDIFVRWKKLEEQPIGWDPDINDGVRLNIRPFIQSDILRKKPNIKWGVDRGKNLPKSPWGEVRDNDKHLSLKEKLEAREKNKKN